MEVRRDKLKLALRYPGGLDHWDKGSSVFRTIPRLYRDKLESTGAKIDGKPRRGLTRVEVDHLRFFCFGGSMTPGCCHRVHGGLFRFALRSDLGCCWESEQRSSEAQAIG